MVSSREGLREMITSGRLKPEDIPDDFEWLEDKLFCGGCTFLSPKEADQSSEKEKHICSFWDDQEVLHKGHHPRLPTLAICDVGCDIPEED